MNALLASLRERAQRDPEAIVLTGSTVTYTAAALQGEVQGLANLFREQEVQRLALHADNSPGWIIIDLAAQLAGVVLVPVPTFFTADQVRWLLDAAGVDAVASTSEAVLVAAFCTESRVTLLDGLSMAFRPAVAATPLPERTAKITFTSGSTGQPKGVCLSTEQCLVVARSLLQRTALTKVRHLALLPLPTLLENIAGVYLPLLAGGQVCVPGSADTGLAGSSGLDAQRFLALLARERPESLILVPELLRVLVGATAAGWVAPDSLRFVAVGGARVAPALVSRARAAGLPVYEGYGLSECASVVALNGPGNDRPGTCGQVLPHLVVHVNDGELQIEGNAFLGYLGDPESWYPERVASGDLGRLEEGFLVVAGRRKHLLITAYGRNVSPEWVESELLASGALLQAVVLGDARASCCALLYPRDAAMSDANLQALVDAANERLPDYARIGAWQRLSAPLSARDGLLTPNGKPRRQVIAARFQGAIDSLYQPEELPQL
ncbi:AMP-binding protein [Parahaliea aestuarii]|uniref:AMP-binding protein n=1 Tax=Parahaliea aestuarii TaxID=1852021 RepID=UPI00164F968D|nr:AMP-binding protein [Parahaliea aestuarii]